MSTKQTANSKKLIWRDAQLPFLEVRYASNGSEVCYAKHLHPTFSIGAVLAGYNRYFDGVNSQLITQGTVVLINPNIVHACNPIPSHAKPWQYLMLYIDTAWLAALQEKLNISKKGYFCQFTTSFTTNTYTYHALCRLYQLLISNTLVLNKQVALFNFFTHLHHHEFIIPVLKTSYSKMDTVADFITQHCLEDLHIEALCKEVNLSPYYLIHSFKKYYGISPYAFLINKRIQRGQLLLKQGQTISEVALSTGFSDQAHFQRTFKKLLAMTPKQYQAM